MQLAQKLNITKQTVSNWENENIQPSVEMLIRLSGLFRVTADYLLGMDDLKRIDVSDLPTTFVAHLVQIIDDYRTK